MPIAGQSLLQVLFSLCVSATDLEAAEIGVPIPPPIDLSDCSQPMARLLAALPLQPSELDLLTTNGVELPSIDRGSLSTVVASYEKTIGEFFPIDSNTNSDPSPDL